MRNCQRALPAEIAPGGTPAADTGHWRGSNDLQEITVRKWLRALPAGAVTVSFSYALIIHHPFQKSFPKNSHLMIPGKILSLLLYYYIYYYIIIILIMIRGRFSDPHPRVFRLSNRRFSGCLVSFRIDRILFL